MFDDDKTIDEILDTYWDEIRKADHLVTTIQVEAKRAIERLKKTPRQFRNDFYQHLTSHGVSQDTAMIIAGESEVYASAFEAYQLRGIEFAARSMGFDERTANDDTRAKDN